MSEYYINSASTSRSNCDMNDLLNDAIKQSSDEIREMFKLLKQIKQEELRHKKFVKWLAISIWLCVFIALITFVGFITD